MNTAALKKLLQDEGISQNELARRMGVSTAHMSNIVNGKREARVDLFKRICTMFRRDPRELW